MEFSKQLKSCQHFLEALRATLIRVSRVVVVVVTLQGQREVRGLCGSLWLGVRGCWGGVGGNGGGQFLGGGASGARGLCGGVAGPGCGQVSG